MSLAEHMGWGILQEGWRKGPWTAEEDRLLIEHVKLHGEGRWSSVANLTGLKRNGKSCRLRWVNYLRPDLKRGQITPHEETVILELHAKWGNRWSTIARSLPGRTDNEIKNYWRTHFNKKPKLSDSNVKLKDRVLRRQQLYQQQQQNQVDMKKIMSLFDGTENKVPSLPHVMQDMVANTVCPNIMEEHGFMCSVFNSYPYVPEVSNEDILWDGLWNLDDVHATLSLACATNKASPWLFDC